MKEINTTASIIVSVTDIWYMSSPAQTKAQAVLPAYTGWNRAVPGPTWCSVPPAARALLNPLVT